MQLLKNSNYAIHNAASWMADGHRGALGLSAQLHVIMDYVNELVHAIVQNRIVVGLDAMEARLSMKFVSINPAKVKLFFKNIFIK